MKIKVLKSGGSDLWCKFLLENWAAVDGFFLEFDEDLFTDLWAQIKSVHV